MSQLNLYNRPTRQHRKPDRFSFSSQTSDTNTSDGSTSDTNSSECSNESSFSDVISPSSATDISQFSGEAPSKHNSSLGCEVIWTSSQEISETTPSCMSSKSGTRFHEEQHQVACLLNLAHVSMRTVLCPLYHSTIHKTILHRTILLMLQILKKFLSIYLYLQKRHH